MAKVRVSTLAKELGMTSKDLLLRLHEAGEFVPSAASTIDQVLADKLRRSLGSDGRESMPSGRELSPTPASMPRQANIGDMTTRPAGWRAGAVPLPKNPDLLDSIERMGRRFPAFREHLAALRDLGSQVVYAGMCQQGPFRSSGIALVRFSGAIEAGFGFTREVMLFYSPHDDLQGRTFEAAVRELEKSERSVTPDVFFMWAPDQRLRTKLDDWSRPSRLAIPLLIDSDDQFSLISLLRDYVYSRDLFYVTTPVRGASFFGRRTLLQSLRQDVFNQRVTGLFGLRKSGKTSILLQLKEELREERIVSVLMDLETFPSPPEDPTDDILAELRRRLISELKLNGLRTRELSESSERPSILELKNAIQDLLAELARDQVSVLLMLDEIEYLTPADRIDVAEGDMPRVAQFLSALRSLVQETQNFTFVLSGLTSAIVEGGRLYGRPNPLFSWARSVYVSPLTRDEADDLATTVGAKMGIRLERGALEALHEASGGHAFLYRSLSSAVVTHLPQDDYQRTMTRTAVLGELHDWRSRVRGNIEEMIQHVKRYYPDEAILLEILMDSPDDFEYVAAGEDVAVRRLSDLGLIYKENERFETSVVLDLL